MAGRESNQSWMPYARTRRLIAGARVRAQHGLVRVDSTSRQSQTCRHLHGTPANNECVLSNSRNRYRTQWLNKWYVYLSSRTDPHRPSGRLTGLFFRGLARRHRSSGEAGSRPVLTRCKSAVLPSQPPTERVRTDALPSQDVGVQPMPLVRQGPLRRRRRRLESLRPRPLQNLPSDPDRARVVRDPPRSRPSPARVGVEPIRDQARRRGHPHGQRAPVERDHWQGYWRQVAHGSESQRPGRDRHAPLAHPGGHARHRVATGCHRDPHRQGRGVDRPPRGRIHPFAGTHGFRDLESLGTCGSRRRSPFC